MKITLHEDGTATYWSTKRQQPVRASHPPIEDMECMSREDRIVIMGHVMENWEE